MGRRTVTAFISALVLAGLLAAPGARATLIGDVVLIEQYRTTLGTLRSDSVTVVTPSPEIVCPGTYQLCSANIPGAGGSINIEASSIRFDIGPAAGNAFDADTFNGFIFSNLDWMGGPGTITGVTLSTDIAGLDAARVDFGADFVRVNLQALTANSDEFFLVDLRVTQGVPEPGTLILLGLGLAGLAASRRRKQ